MNSMAVAASITTLAGIVIQYFRVLIELRENERDVVQTWRAGDDLVAEVPWWRPLRKRRRQREVGNLLADHPEDRRAYNRIKWTLYGWAVLVAGAVLAVAATLLPA